MAPAAKVAEHQGTTVHRVLLVDDHEMYLKYCTRDFVRAGIAVSSTQTLAGAVEIVRREQPDVVVVDLFLTPPESGLEVIRAVKEIDPNVFCILVSAHMSVSHALMGVRAGADDVFIKPVAARQVISRVEQGVVDAPNGATPTLHEVEWEHISRVLHDHKGNISHAAESLGIFRQSLQRKIQKYAPRVIATGEEQPYPVAPPKLDEEEQRAPAPAAKKPKAKAPAKQSARASATPPSHSESPSKSGGKSKSRASAKSRRRH
ncbi:MAG TPA: response regulator [Kofleriaceae bacterium]|nr:response regulator [Kofleriaceae bacterium]